MDNRDTIEQLILSRTRPPRWNEAVLPDYAGYSIVGVAALIERLFGLPAQPSPVADLVDTSPPSRHTVLLLLDGFGYRQAQELFRRFPDLALRSIGEDGVFLPVTSVFPSTTVAALASLGTGMTPLEHGLIGYRLYLRETSAITNMIRFAMVGNGKTDAAFRAGLDPDTIVPGTTIHERLALAGVHVHALLPQHIASSGLSRALYKGSSKLHAVSGFPDMVVAARRLLAEASSPTFLTLYWPGLDAVAHLRGPETDAYVAELRTIDATLRRELLGRADDTLLVVCSDHGFVAMQPGDYVRLDALPGVEPGLMLPPVGEPRASYLYTRRGHHRDVTQQLMDRLGDGLIVEESSRLVEEGVFGTGTPHPDLARRSGDVAIVATGQAGIFHPYQDATLLAGMHGGLTEREMLVPLIIGTV